MSSATKLVAFATVLVLAFGAAALAGAAIDPDGSDPRPAHGDEPAGAHGDEPAGAHGDEPAGAHGDEHGSAPPAPAAGLAVADAGLTLAVDDTSLRRGRNRIAFRVLDARGEPLTRFDEIHERRMHFIVVRRDTATFEHVHPRTDGDGNWTIGVDLPAAGSYRAYADFATGGEQRTLAADLTVPGDFEPQSLPEPATDASDAGYDVVIDAGDPHAGEESALRFRVERDGARVADLEDYLGAKGHLVALRDGDLAYLHVHPTAGEPGEIPFAATFPTPGTYRLFLQFQVDGAVRTVDYTLDVHR